MAGKVVRLAKSKHKKSTLGYGGHADRPPYPSPKRGSDWVQAQPAVKVVGLEKSKLKKNTLG